eukprot:9013940-Pyramimonas_sp.AAC.1
MVGNKNRTRRRSRYSQPHPHARHPPGRPGHVSQASGSRHPQQILTPNICLGNLGNPGECQFIGTH